MAIKCACLNLPLSWCWLLILNQQNSARSLFAKAFINQVMCTDTFAVIILREGGGVLCVLCRGVHGPCVMAQFLTRSAVKQVWATPREETASAIFLRGSTCSRVVWLLHKFTCSTNCPWVGVGGGGFQQITEGKWRKRCRICQTVENEEI